MAIKFLSNVDIQGSLTLNDNQLTNFVVENLSSDPSYANSFVGRLYYNNSATPGTLKVCVEVNSGTSTATYVSLDSTDGVNTFTNSNGTYVSAGTQNSSATGDVTMGTIDLSAADGVVGGNTTRFLTKDNTWAVPDYTTDSGGTVTGVSGTAPIVSSGGTTPAISISDMGAASAGSAGTAGAVPAPVAGDQVKFLRGDGTFATPSGSYTSWTLSDGSNTTGIADGDTATFSGGTYITTTEGSGSLSIAHDLTTRSDTTSVDTVGSAGSFTKVDSITTNATGHVTAINVETITMGSFDDYSSWTLSGDGGTSQTISSGGTVDIAGGTNISTSASATNTLTVDLDDSITLSGDLTVQGGDITLSAVATTVTLIDDTASALTFSSSGSANVLTIDTTATEGVSVTGLFSASGAATLTGGFSAGADSAMGTNKITGLKTATNTDEATNLGQVQSLVAGVGVFQGAYNASTNSPALSGASNVALTTGDYFVVSVDGTNAVLGVLEVGDLIFANNDITAASSPNISNYTVVRQDANIAGANTTDSTTEKGVSGFDSAFFDVSVNGWVQIKSNGIPLGTNTSGNYIQDIAASAVAGDEGISVTGSGSASASGVVGLAIDGLTDIGSSIADTDDFVVFNGTNNKKVEYSTIADNIASSHSYTDTFPGSDNNTWTVTHALGVNVMVQTWLEATGQAVYIDFARTNSTTLTFTASSTITADTIRVLVTK